MFAVVYSAPAVAPAIFDPGVWGRGPTSFARAQTEAADGPDRLKRLSVQLRGMGLPEQEIVVRSTVREERDGIFLVDTLAEQAGNAIIRNAEAELHSA